ncbi:MAG: tetratricopeptide repeat protein, partial [Chloroflexota bacterium]
LRQLLGEAQRAGTATALRLARLTRAAVDELARAIAPTNSLGERLFAETEGVPFFIVEYLAAIAESEGRDAEGALPSGVRNLLRARLRAVSQTATQVLNTAAVIGHSFDFDSVREASGRSEDETVAALEELIARGLIAEIKTASGGESPTYDFSHEKLRALAYAETSQARRRLIHRRVADALVARPPRRTLAARASLVAQHYQLAGADAQAAEYFKLAGEHARGLYANAEALSHFRNALALGHAETGALHEAIGDLQTLRGDYGAALTSYETAATLCASDALGSVEHKIGSVHLRQGAWGAAESHFESALATLLSDGARARLYADWSFAARQRGAMERARELARQSLALAEAADDRRALAEAHNILGVIARSRDDADDAREHLQQSLRLAEMLDDASARMTALNNLALVYGDHGERAAAMRFTEQALQLCVALGDRHREAALRNNLADLLHADGQTEAAMAHLKQAVAIFAEIGGSDQPAQPEIWKLTEW